MWGAKRKGRPFLPYWIYVPTPGFQFYFPSEKWDSITQYEKIKKKSAGQVGGKKGESHARRSEKVYENMKPFFVACSLKEKERRDEGARE